MRAKKWANLLLVMFLAVMLFFTVFARKIYEISLPKVVTEQVIWTSFPIELVLEDGQSYLTNRKALSIPMAACRENKVLLCDESEPYCLLYEQIVEYGERYADRIEIVNGLSAGMQVVIESDRMISDGDKGMRVK